MHRRHAKSVVDWGAGVCDCAGVGGQWGQGHSGWQDMDLVQGYDLLMWVMTGLVLVSGVIIHLDGRD